MNKYVIELLNRTTPLKRLIILFNKLKNKEFKLDYINNYVIVETLFSRKDLPIWLYENYLKNDSYLRIPVKTMVEAFSIHEELLHLYLNEETKDLISNKPLSFKFIKKHYNSLNINILSKYYYTHPQNDIKRKKNIIMTCDYECYDDYFMAYYVSRYKIYPISTVQKRINSEFKFKYCKIYYSDVKSIHKRCCIIKNEYNEKV